MADPLKILSSLDHLADSYAVFEQNQVLTPGQLNSVSSFSTTRIALPASTSSPAPGSPPACTYPDRLGGVRITRGLGVTTDGDLLMLADDTVYDRCKPYGPEVPRYDRFHPDPNAEAMIELFELVASGAEDPAAQPLAVLREAGLDGKVVLLLMESVVTAQDRCNGTACDNLGGDARFRQRVLLANRADVEAWQRNAAQSPVNALVELAVDRPTFDRSITTVDALATRYRTGCRRTLARVTAALTQLSTGLPGLLDQVFARDPVGEWQARLERHAVAFDGSSHGLQCWYEFLKDLADTWNDLREALYGDTATILPDLDEFPKHLLLGDLVASGLYRTQWRPSPVDALARVAAARARFMLRKLDALIGSFAPPSGGPIRVTPSFSAATSLEERAVPWYYLANGASPAHTLWNHRLSERRQAGHLLGYRAGDWASTAHARTPLAFAIDRHDLFRIEGHLGQPAEVATAELRRQIASNNLPFEVQAVLLHDKHRGRIRVKPGIRYTNLHSLHHLVRKDVGTRLDEGVQFGTKFRDRVQEAAAQQQIPNDDNASVDFAESAVASIKAAQQIAAPVLAKATYSAYRANPAWKAAVPGTIESIGNARTQLGGVTRNDFTSPYDSLISSNQVLWLDWLDELIDADDDRADARLLFSAFVARHPGVDHVGGVPRGGTWVLVYNDDGNVVSDFALPYPAAEADLPEPVEPPLTLPPYKPPVILDRATRVQPPIDRAIRNSFVAVKAEWQKELSIQTANVEGLVKGAALSTSTRPIDIGTGRKVLDALMDDVVIKQRAVVDAASLANQPGISAEERDLATTRLKEAQSELATSVLRATEHAVDNDVDLASGQAASAAPVLIGSMGYIKDAAAAKTIKDGLSALSGRVSGAQQPVIGGMAALGGFKIKKPTR